MDVHLSDTEKLKVSEVLADQPVTAKTQPTREWGPKILTPKMRQAIRMITAGKSIREIADELKYSKSYLDKFFCTDIAKIERARLQNVVEASFVDKAASAASGAPEIGSATIEVKEAELEAIQELRRLLIGSKSDQARAIAAKELLELSHLKQRMASLAKPSGEETGTMSEKDIQEFNRAVADLREIALIGSSKPPAPNSDSPQTAAQQETPEGVASSEADAPAVQHDQDGSQK